MLVPDLLRVEILLVRRFIDLLEDILETPIVLLQDRVLGAHVQRERLVQRNLETSVREAFNGLVGVVLGLGHTPSVLELENLNLVGLAALGREDHLEGPIAFNHQVLCSVLVSKGVTADDDGLLPP